jgi:hypothetical protein
VPGLGLVQQRDPAVDVLPLRLAQPPVRFGAGAHRPGRVVQLCHQLPVPPLADALVGDRIEAEAPLDPQPLRRPALHVRQGEVVVQAVVEVVVVAVKASVATRG